jgi:glutathione S-transferase
MIELVSHPLCPYVHRAAALLTEKDVSFEMRFVDLEAKPRWFLDLSPRGKVPVLVTHGTALFESVVILEYLDEAYPPRLLPDDALGRARLRMWIEISNDLMTAHYKIAIAETAPARDAAKRNARDVLTRFEKVVVGPWFTGDQLTLVDFAAGPALIRFERLDRWLGTDLYRDLPKVTAWSRAVSEHAAFTRTLVPDFDDRFRALIAEHHADELRRTA